MLKCFGPVASPVINGKLISVCAADDSSIFARSAASRRRCRASLSFDKSMPLSFLNSATKWSNKTWSKSSPPKCVSPFVDLTSNTPPEISRTETSNVPPPKSYTAITFPSAASIPYASAAAVGSLIMRITFNPAMRPASLVACRCASLKYAGTVITAFVTVCPRNASAVSFIFVNTNAPTWLGEYLFPAASTHASPLSARTILNGMFLMSLCVSLSS
mmetsp:Transcript_2048/g.3620  ORF Transcript_2048/g.3620 Transcript_2048/m.3620 type:complete len:217 (+) Transcript_2048:1333-1983(+)